MIFIGPLAQSSGKLPRNLKESCFRLVVRMQRVIKLRKGMVKAKMHLSRYNEPSQPYGCESFCLFFPSRLWNFIPSWYPSWRIILTKSWKVLHNSCVCVFVCTMCLHNDIKWLIGSTVLFSLLNEWSLILLMEFRQTILLILKAGIWIIQELHRIVYRISLFKGKGKFPAEFYPHNHRKVMVRLKEARHCPSPHPSFCYGSFICTSHY